MANRTETKQINAKKERRFYNSLRDIFVGAKVEGESGYINLMKIKSRYFEKGVFPQLQKDIEEALKPFPDFREELFDKLYTFFSRYFSESGSIYFRYTPLHQNVYEKIYTDDKDVMLFWKTRMLYYVKTDRLFNNLEVEVGGFKFFFDVSTLQHKKANEKRQIIYEFKKKRNDGVLVFTVAYSERGRKTKVNDILRELNKGGIKVKEEVLERAFRLFERQSEVDYFINKNAKAFLEEQFNLWLYQYVFSGQSQWTEQRIKQVQVLKDIAFKIIAFISQFEDELVKIWNKPKFVLNSNYVITLDRIEEKDEDLKLVKKILNHKNFNQQMKEWKELGIAGKDFTKSKIIEKDLNVEHLSEKYQHLPIDTKYFKDLELKILGLFDDLDNSLDGWLIKSENYQALNTILPKFKEQVQTIYIDPPFNTGEDFDYVDRFQDSSWISLLNNRLEIAKSFLSKLGSIFVHLDHNAEHFGRTILENIFKNGFINNIAWSYRTGGASKKTALPYKHESILFFAKNADNFIYYPVYERQYLEKSFMGAKQDNEGRYYTDTLLRDVIEGEIKDFTNNKVFNTRPVLNLSREFYGFKTQKPEGLLYLLQYLTSGNNNQVIFIDFFAGSGTSLAVAQKKKKKWIGIEMGEYCDNFYIDEVELNNTEKNKKDLYKKFVVLDYKEDGQKIKAVVKKVGILGRQKQVLSGSGRNEPCGISKDINWQGGGFFKYYELEQYEDSLRKVRYEDSDLFDDPYQDPYHQYVFLRDLKMLEALKVDIKKNKVKVDLSKIYSGLDIAETLSNLTGKWIKKIGPDFVQFENGTKIDTKNLDYKLIKPLIWW